MTPGVALTGIGLFIVGVVLGAVLLNRGWIRALMYAVVLPFAAAAVLIILGRMEQGMAGLGYIALAALIFAPIGVGVLAGVIVEQIRRLLRG